MAPDAPSLPPDLSKLTVPRLRALCKERRITGYSKLGKAALLQRLTEVTTPVKAATPSNVLPSRSTTTVPSTAPTNGAQDHAYMVPSTTCREGNVVKVVQQPGRPSTVESTETTRQAPASGVPSKLATPSQGHTVASTTGTRKSYGTKRLAHIDISGPPKRVAKTSVKHAASAVRELSAPRISERQQTLPVTSSEFKIPEVHVQPKRPSHDGPSTLTKQPSSKSKGPAVPRQTTGGAGRFKSLVVSRAKQVEPDRANKGLSRAPTASTTNSRISDSSPVFSGRDATPLPVLSNISFPPKASERRWVYRWAIVLSALSPADRRTCSLVSRTFRYAVYLSAAHTLSKDYPGRRLNAILEQHPRNMTNLWPYLRFRTIEVSERRYAFKQSFLGQYTNSLGYCPLSARLWTCPDDIKQIDIALRFILTRMWFAVSVGAYGHDASRWSRSVVRDAQEIVKGEVWHVITQDNTTDESCSYYVLEATCEVIGQPPSSQAENMLGYSLRADWTTWISRRLQASMDSGPSLLDWVKWSNTEDYHLGISKAWLLRVQGQDTDSVAKRSVAERYILASVVANGISGSWMSTSAMAQEFAGLPSNHTLGSRAAERSINRVNMYLPAHHHIESIHFTTAKGEALHTGVAVVQTPGREYHVLRENGMQVGCEEEGIPCVWQRILGCDALGRACNKN